MHTVTMDTYRSRYGGQEGQRSHLEELGYQEQGEAIVRELKRLCSAYPRVSFGKRDLAPCSVWRSERIQIGDERLSRFASRVHLFEGAGSKLGRYIGYASLRPFFVKESTIPYFRYTAIVNLAPPRYMLRPRYHLITCMTGPADGVLPFRSIPFCFPTHATQDPASCLHAALAAALILKMDSYGFTPISSRDMLSFLWNETKEPIERLKQGASLADALKVLGSNETFAGGVLETIPWDAFSDTNLSYASDTEKTTSKQAALREAHHCLAEYLANGIPCIVEVNSKHAILLVGMHLLEGAMDSQPTDETQARMDRDRTDTLELPSRFVVHDINRHPYSELRAKDLLEQAWVEDSVQPGLTGVHFLAILPRGANIGIYDVRRLAKHRSIQDLSPNLLGAYWADYKPRVPIPVNISTKRRGTRLVTRLLNTYQVQHRYLPPTENLSSGQGAEIEVAREAILEVAEETQPYWWCVEIRLYSRTVVSRDAEREPPPLLVYMWSIGDDTVGQARVSLLYTGNRRAKLRTSKKEVEFHFDTQRT